MGQTNEDTQQQKPRICKLAVASPLVSIIGFLAAIGVLVLFSFLVDIFPSSAIYLLSYSILFAFFVPPLVGFIAGIIADQKISRSKGLLKGRAFSILGIVLGFIPVLSVVLFGIFMPALCRVPRAEQKVLCGANLARLGKAIQAYSERYEKYPTKDIWCDLLVEHADVNKENFLCKGALKNGDKGPCHYALNPNCFPNSPNDVVLIFETKGGWNKYGGPELMTAEHHRYEGCNVLFNSDRVNFIATYQGILQPDKLRWDNKPHEKNQKISKQQVEEALFKYFAKKKKETGGQQVAFGDITEITNEEVYGRMGLQIFNFQTPESFNHKVVHSLAAKGRELLFFIPGLMGSTGTTSHCVADMDRDGKPDLFYTHSGGSGIYQTWIEVLRWDGTGYVTGQVAILFDLAAVIKKVDDQNIEIEVVEPYWLHTYEGQFTSGRRKIGDLQLRDGKYYVCLDFAKVPDLREKQYYEQGTVWSPKQVELLDVK